MRCSRRSGNRWRCHDEAVEGRKYCALHLAKARGYNDRQVQAWIAEGVCVGCGRPRDVEGRRTCTSCADRAARAVVARKSQRRMVFVTPHLTRPGRLVEVYRGPRKLGDFVASQEAKHEEVWAQAVAIFNADAGQRGSAP